MKIKHLDLPEIIKIKILKTKRGYYIAEFIDYDVFTQAKSFEELPYLVNDLIYTYFDVPKELQALYKLLATSVMKKALSYKLKANTLSTEVSVA